MPVKKKTFTRDEAWRFQYRIRPYLRYMNDDKLRKRMAAIMRNLTTVSHEGLISVFDMNQAGVLWSQKMTDLITECERRRIDPVSLQTDLSGIPFLKKEALEVAKRNADLHNSFSRRTGLYKFISSEFSEQFLRNGTLMISPASSYDDASYNDAIRDDEMTISTVITPFDYDLGTIDPYFRRLAPERCHMFVDHKKPSNHYLFCVSVKFDLRYFFDFGYDACVCIHNQDEFVSRLLSKVSEALPSWDVRFDAAKYIDPYFLTSLLPGDSPEMYFIKDFEYMYQFEHRLVAIPPKGHNGSISRFKVELGSLTDIAQVIYLR